jgi:hypothetical protein
MDDAVIRSIAKWPNVPSAYGWLSLDRRGDWSVKGERISNPTIVEFIGRNYASDERGRWFFQNGPQRVFVALEYTPWVLRTDGDGGLLTHTGQAVTDAAAAWLDEQGALLIECMGAVGVLHDRDLQPLLQALHDEEGAPLTDERMEAWLAGEPLQPKLRLGLASVSVGRIQRASVPQRYRFDPAPHPGPGEPEC